MEIETLYNMTKNVTKGAERALENKNFQGFYAYFNEYNSLVNLVINELGEEAELLFQPMDGEKIIKTADLKGASDESVLILCGVLLEVVYTRLISLTSFLQGKLSTVDSRVQSIIDLIRGNLRRSLFEEPKDEKGVKNVIQTILNVRNINHEREKVSISYSSKAYVPDFTFDELNLALEVKFCKIKSKEKALIDEINADIPSYKTRYKRLIFVIYDLGFIRDVSKFKSGIEDNVDVYVIVIKK